MDLSDHPFFLSGKVAIYEIFDEERRRLISEKKVLPKDSPQIVEIDAKLSQNGYLRQRLVDSEMCLKDRWIDPATKGACFVLETAAERLHRVYGSEDGRESR